MNNVVSLNRLVIRRVKRNWYIGRVAGACFFARSRSEIVLKHRRWQIAQESRELALLARVRLAAAMGDRSC